MNKILLVVIIILVVLVLVIAGFFTYSLIGKKTEQKNNQPNTSQEINSPKNTATNINQSTDETYKSFFSCIDKCPSGSCPQPNCRPDYSTGKASIGWVGECTTGSFTDCIDPTCFDKCISISDNSLKNGNYQKIPSTNILNAIKCADASGEKGKDCVTIVNIGTYSNAVYKQYLKYNCANSCWQSII